MSAPAVTKSARPRPGPPREYQFPRFFRRRLTNGVELVVAPVSKLPIATVVVLVDAGAVRLLQWLLILTALVGGGWTLALAASGSLGDDAVPEVAGIDVPILMLVGGVVAGILLALLCRLLVAATARKRAATANRRLRAAVHEVSSELVVAPVERELEAFRTVRTGLDKALGH